MKQSLAKGTKLGSYSIIRLVGRGGMGEVYEAYEHRLRRTVALKVIAPLASGQHDEVDLVRRFVKEAHTLAQINHPNVVTIYTIDSQSDVQFIAMEYVDGSTLKKLASLIALSGDEAAPLFLQALEGLRSLHDNQILHRDLKPNNLMVRLDGKLKVLDFGIAKRFGDKRGEHTEVGVVVGTLPYLAPEILTGQRADVRSDLWSLGAIFYETLTGQPLVSLTTRQIRGIRALPDSDVIFPEQTLAWIPEQMRTFVARLCDGRPDHRFANAQEAIEALRQFQQNRPSLPSEFMRSFHDMLSKVQDMPADEKNSKDSIEKRALAVSLLSGEPVENAEKRLEPEPVPEDNAQFTQVIVDSVSKRNRARKQRAQEWKQAAQVAAYAIGGMLLFKGATLIINNHQQPTPAAQVAQLLPPVEVNTPQEEPIRLTGPQSNAKLWMSPSELPTLSWSKVLPAQEYELQIATEPSFARPLIRESVSGNIYRPGRILPEGDYYWRLISMRDQKASVTPSHFSISYIAPVDLSWPATNQLFILPREQQSYQLALAWKCRMGAASYRVQISRDSSFKAIDNEQVIQNACNTDQSFLPDGTFYWRVRIEEPAVAQAGWSEIRAVSIIPAKEQVAPKQPTVVAKVTRPAPAPIVRAAPAPVKHTAPKPRVVAKVKPAPVRTPASVEQPTPAQQEVIPPPSMASEPATGPDIPSPLSPANGIHVAIGATGKLSVVFSWTTVSAATDYVIEIAHDSEFKSRIDRHAVKPAKYVLRNKELSGNIYWRVRTITPSGPSAWSPANSFEVTNSQVAKKD